MLTLYIGSYTEYPIPDFGGIGKGICTVQLDTETGVLKTIYSKMARNPSYLTISDDNQFLYCNTELDQSEDPKVSAYKINDDFSLEFLNEQPISGGYPCHINYVEKSVLVACYASGNIIQYPLDASGRLLKAQKEYCHKGSSINELRQETPHPHQAVVHPNKKDIYVCDLGIDTVKAYYFEKGQLVPNPDKDSTVTAGGGPRHLTFNAEASLAYVINELTGNISVLENKNGAFKEIATYASLPETYKEVPSASAIRLHPNGKFLYAANRAAELISIFKVSGKELILLTYQYTQGKEVREFNITPDGKWLIACHQNSHDTVVYKIQGNGTLNETYRTLEILSPVCVAFLN